MQRGGVRDCTGLWGATSSLMSRELTIRTLDVDDVLEIYGILVLDFAEADDPISPAGVRDLGLLESAVNRQHTGYGGLVKYPTPVLNAASLCYGICCDHAFHNGNKRAALVALLVHLDHNDLCLPSVTQDQLYEVMIAVAGHTITRQADGKKRVNSDEEVEALAKWLRKRSEKVTRGEHPITYRQLRHTLSNYGFYLENAGGNSADLVEYEKVTKGLFRKRIEKRRRRIASIGYRDEGTVISKSEVKKVRRLCKLSEADGVDSTMFYSSGAVIDAFVNKYRKALRRLARV